MQFKKQFLRCEYIQSTISSLRNIGLLLLSILNVTLGARQMPNPLGTTQRKGYTPCHLIGQPLTRHIQTPCHLCLLVHLCGNALPPHHKMPYFHNVLTQISDVTSSKTLSLSAFLRSLTLLLLCYAVFHNCVHISQISALCDYL